jgi:hypothetical protein
MIGHVIDHVIRVRRVVKRIFGSRTRSRYARSYQRERGLTQVGARSRATGGKSEKVWPREWVKGRTTTPSRGSGGASPYQITKLSSIAR